MQRMLGSAFNNNSVDLGGSGEAQQPPVSSTKIPLIQQGMASGNTANNINNSTHNQLLSVDEQGGESVDLAAQELKN